MYRKRRMGGRMERTKRTEEQNTVNGEEEEAVVRDAHSNEQEESGRKYTYGKGIM